MTDPVPAIVATLPARTAEEARREVELARAAGADAAEVRFDRWSSSERARAAGLFPTVLPLIATLRSAAEGGEGPDAPERRAEVLAELSALPFAFLDLEADRDLLAREPFDVRGTGPAPRVVLSTHLPAGALPTEALRATRAPVPLRAIRKVVLPLSTGVAIAELIPALEGRPASPDVVILTTGGSGNLLRALGKKLGFPLVYGSLPEQRGSAAPVEESQVPVDRLRRFFDATGEPRLFALLGHPVRHSLSPRIHTRWLERTGRAGIYITLDIVSREEFDLATRRLEPLGFRGLNVTHPWKAEALAVAAERTPTAAEVGAANCLTLSAVGATAHNTDVLAARRRLEELRASGQWGGDRLAVLGAGGAARATLAAARSLSARVTVYARRRRGAEEIAGRFGAAVGDPKHPLRADLVVHATSAGHGGSGPLEFPLSQLVAPGGHVLDWAYDGADPGLPAGAHHAGATYEDGRRLLVYQAAESFAAWWGEAPPGAAVDDALREVGCTA